MMLGLVAALLDFVPFFGPIASGVLAVLVALAQGPTTALYVAVLCLVIQQIESNLVVPLVQRQTVHLPPAVTVVAFVMVAGLFGLTGMLFAIPLAVVIMVLVKTLYVEGWLERAEGASGEK
jgi:predicted PurR-regulated permease PerM